jgi:hypothetical protein
MNSTQWNEDHCYPLKNTYMLNIKIPIYLPYNNNEKIIYYDNCQYNIEECYVLPPKSNCNELVETIRNLFTPSPPESNSSISTSHTEKEEIDPKDTFSPEINENQTPNDIQNENQTPPDFFSFILKNEIENRTKTHSQHISFKKKPRKINRFTAKMRIPFTPNTKG